jgi:hypothetical protein
MPKVSPVNLSFLNNNRTGSVQALINLATFGSGPLRLEKKVENGVTVTYLGVRSWSTYFFEKLIATPAQVAKAKIKTQAAIEQHVRSFLNNSGLTFGRDPEGLTAALQSKVVGKSVMPESIAEAQADRKGSPGNMPAYRKPPEVLETKGKCFNGATLVPRGLSVAAVSPLRVIANVRLVTEASFQTCPGGVSRKGLTVSQGDFVIDKRNGAHDYKKQYLDRLNSVAGLIHTSVVLEVQRDDGDACSDANLEGARSAAAEFGNAQKSRGKHVSVMLTVPRLTPIAPVESRTVIEIDTAPTRSRNNILVQDPDDETSSE